MLLRLAAGALLSLIAPQWATPQSITIGRPVIVTRDVGTTHKVESLFCENPSDARQLFGASFVEVTESVSGRHIANGVAYYSGHGGRTWMRTLTSSSEVDPACAYGTDGTAFLGFMPPGLKGGLADYVLYRSPDGGRTWEFPVFLHYLRFYDRPYLAVDHGTTPYRGRLYVMGVGLNYPPLYPVDRPDEMVLFASDDAGRTFRGPVTVPTGSRSIDSAQSHYDFVHPGPTAVLPDGTLLTGFTVMFHDSTAGPRPPDEEPGMYKLKVTRSRDGGQTLDEPIVVGRGKWTEGYGDYIPAIAADTTSGPFRNQAYLAWSDNTQGWQRIMFSASSDRGTSWSPPRAISDNGPADPANPTKGPHSHMPSMVVNKDGVIGVFYYVSRTPLPGEWPVFTASFDGGLTWTVPARVTPFAHGGDRRWYLYQWYFERPAPYGDVAPIRVSYGSSPNGAAGDTGGLTTAVSGDFHIFPIADHATGRAEIHMITARPTGRVVKRREVTSDVRVDFRTISYDSVRQTVTVVATLANTSSRDLSVPIALLVDGVPVPLPQQAIGRSPAPPDDERPKQQISALNADNHRTTGGAVWEFRGARSRNVLRPGEHTGPRTLRFGLTDSPRPDGYAERIPGSQMRLDVRAYVLDK